MTEIVQTSVPSGGTPLQDRDVNCVPKGSDTGEQKVFELEPPGLLISYPTQGFPASPRAGPTSIPAVNSSAAINRWR